MNLALIETTPNAGLSAAGRAQILSHRGKPLFVAAWDRVLMIHFEVDAQELQRDVPFPSDLIEGRAFVSLVAFTMRGMRPVRGGKLAAWLCRPIATHDFLNVRTYVRHGGESGIHFLAEWLSSRLAVKLGPPTFGLPYCFGRITRHHDLPGGILNGCVADPVTEARFVYHGRRIGPGGFAPCESGSRDEWLMERYVAFNAARGRKKFFRVWHPPWQQCGVEVVVAEMSLLERKWTWFREARLVGANCSPGFSDVGMGFPHTVRL